MYVLYNVCEMVARGCVGLVVDTVKKLRSGGPDFVSPQCSSTLSCNHFGCHGEGKNFPIKQVASLASSALAINIL